MKRREMGRTLLVGGLALGLLLAATPVVGQETDERVGEVIFAEGRVDGQRVGGSAGPLAVTDSVFYEMTVSTARDSRAQLTFEPRGSLTFEENGEFVLDRKQLEQAGAYAGVVRIKFGFLVAAVSSLFGIDTDTAEVGVQGTVFAVRVVDDGTTTVWAFEALGDDLSVTSKSTGDSIYLESGYVTVVAPGAAPTPPIPFDPKSGAAGGLVLPLPGGLPDVFDEPPLPP
ncbi:MAG TPA: FecR domain-containing protein, partial [Thermoanaerobaculia bacterium]|nr:FecR domain-containing protein [Thermoanaerobaculia bacterium]